MQTEEGFIDCPSEEDIEITSFIAHKYGLPFDIVPLHKEYWDTVVAYTVDTVRRGLTPNPDVMCNRLIKFGAFEQKCGHNFDKIATGHYARIGVVKGDDITLTAGMDCFPPDASGGRLFLGTAADRIKDQTYFLAQLEFSQVSRLMFPIGDLQKSEVREIATAEGLPSATRKDSQGICFLGKINYNDFIRRYLGVQKGRIVDIDTGAILGQHEGFWFHTIGQRKGLGLSGGPWYVIDKNIEENIIYVAHGFDTSAQYGNTVRIRGFRYITSDLLGSLDTPAPVTLKIRHTPEFANGTLQLVHQGNAATTHQAHNNKSGTGSCSDERDCLAADSALQQTSNDIWVLQSETPLQGIASGQFAVVYDRSAKLCLGSGVIC
jgi:tRNA-specific 2-thiouridylase